MKERLAWLAERIEALSLRERMLMFLAIAVIIWAAWQTLLMDPVDQRHKSLQQRIEALSGSNTELQQQVEAILARQVEDPNRAMRERIANVEAELGQVNAELREQASNLVTPQEMARALERILAESDEVMLVSASSLSPTPILTAPGADGDESVRIYKHGLRLEFEGAYLPAMAYLERLEQLPWKLFWDRFDFQVKQYPRSRAVITVYTLSFNESWIGV